MEPVSLTIDYKGIERHYSAAVIKYGYTYRVQVTIEEFTINFEPDEEGQFRAIVNEQDKKLLRHLDVDLIESIAKELQAALG